MKSLTEYIAESEAWIDEPAVGDTFAINIREECLLETYVIDTTEDGYVLHADQRMLHLLESFGYLTENDEARDAMQNAVIHRITMQNADLLQRYGVEAVLTAVEDVVDDMGDMEEIGSSDVSAYVEMVKDQLGDRHGSKEEMIDRKPFAETKPSQSTKPDDSLLQRMMELAGVPRRVGEGDISQIEKDIADAPVKPIAAMEADDEDDIIDDLDAEAMDDENLDEAEYQGRKVPLGKPMKGDVKKSKVYVKGPKGNVVKVNFGDPNMKIKKSNPKRRKSFRARHNCDNPGPRWKARYWSCRAW